MFRGLLIAVVLLGVGQPLSAASVASGPGQGDAQLVILDIAYPFTPWLSGAVHAVIAEREHRAHKGLGADLIVGHKDVLPAVTLSLGRTYWFTTTERLDGHHQWHIAITVAGESIFGALHHWSNGGGFPLADCACRNVGENFLVLGWRF